MPRVEIGRAIKSTQAPSVPLSTGRHALPINHMELLCTTPGPRLAIKRRGGLMGRSHTTRSASRGGRHAGVNSMQDLLWIGITFGLLAASLAYVRLCGGA